MVFELEYFWAILLLFIMERICCLQEQFDKDFLLLPDLQRSNESLHSDIENFAFKDPSLKLSFLRLCRLMHITMLLTLVYFCNICLWYMKSKRSLPKALRFKFHMTLPAQVYNN